MLDRKGGRYLFNHCFGTFDIMGGYYIPVPTLPCAIIAFAINSVLSIPRKNLGNNFAFIGCLLDENGRNFFDFICWANNGILSVLLISTLLEVSKHFQSPSTQRALFVVSLFVSLLFVYDFYS